MTSLTEFNALTSPEAAEVLRPCLDVPRWIDGVVNQRPYADIDEVFVAARSVADPFTDDETEAAMAHHPRIGERAGGDSSEASLSRSEQAALNLDEDVELRLREGNRAYEERFGRIFLIRAAGRTSRQILDILEVRLNNDPVSETVVVGDQLREIALVRLAGVIT